MLDFTKNQMILDFSPRFIEDNPSVVTIQDTRFMELLGAKDLKEKSEVKDDFAYKVNKLKNTLNAISKDLGDFKTLDVKYYQNLNSINEESITYKNIKNWLIGGLSYPPYVSKKDGLELAGIAENKTYYTVGLVRNNTIKQLDLNSYKNNLEKFLMDNDSTDSVIVNIDDQTFVEYVVIYFTKIDGISMLDLFNSLDKENTEYFKSDFPIITGLSGTTLDVVDLAEQTGTIILRGSGRGKTRHIKNILTQLILTKDSNEVEINYFSDKLPYANLNVSTIPLITKYITNPSNFLTELENINKDLQCRKDLLKEGNCENFKAYKKSNKSELKYKVIFIDNLYDNFLKYLESSDDVSSILKVRELLTSLAESGRSLGVHLVVSSSRALNKHIPKGFLLNTTFKIADTALSESELDILFVKNSYNKINSNPFIEYKYKNMSVISSKFNSLKLVNTPDFITSSDKYEIRNKEFNLVKVILKNKMDTNNASEMEVKVPNTSPKEDGKVFDSYSDLELDFIENLNENNKRTTQEYQTQIENYLKEFESKDSYVSNFEIIKEDYLDNKLNINNKFIYTQFKDSDTIFKVLQATLGDGFELINCSESIAEFDIKLKLTKNQSFNKDLLLMNLAKYYNANFRVFSDLSVDNKILTLNIIKQPNNNLKLNLSHFIEKDNSDLDLTIGYNLKYSPKKIDFSTTSNLLLMCNDNIKTVNYINNIYSQLLLKSNSDILISGYITNTLGVEIKESDIYYDLPTEFTSFIINLESLISNPASKNHFIVIDDLGSMMLDMYNSYKNVKVVNSVIQSFYSILENAIKSDNIKIIVNINPKDFIHFSNIVKMFTNKHLFGNLDNDFNTCLKEEFNIYNNDILNNLILNHNFGICKFEDSESKPLVNPLFINNNLETSNMILHYLIENKNK